MNNILKMIAFFASCLILIYIISDIYNSNKKMNLLVKFVNGKNIYCENNIIINSKKGWSFNYNDKVFIKKDFYINFNDNKCY